MLSLSRQPCYAPAGVKIFHAGYLAGRLRHNVSFSSSLSFSTGTSTLFCFCFFVFIWGDSLLSFRRTPNKGAWSIPIGPCHRLMRCLCILIAPTGNRTRACRVAGEDFGTAPRVWPVKVHNLNSFQTFMEINWQDQN